MPKATLIVNPRAGAGKVVEAVEAAAEFWRSNGWSVTVESSRRAGDAKQLAQAAVQRGQQLILAAGGDGTLGEVAGGLVGTEGILAPIPTGTGNSFAKELRLPFPGSTKREEVVLNCSALASGRVFAIDTGRGDNGHSWLLWGGIGADGQIVRQVEPRTRLIKRLGRAGYLGAGLPAIPKFGGMTATIKVDDREFSGDYIMVTVSNCRLYAGGELVLSPEAVLDDGCFEVWLFKGRSRLQVLRYAFELLKSAHLSNPNVVCLRGRRVTVSTSDPIPVQEDGDPRGMTPFSSTVRPRSLNVLVPNTAPSDLFTHAGVPFRQG